MGLAIVFCASVFVLAILPPGFVSGNEPNASVATSQWLRFRGPAGNGLAADSATPPVEWSKDGLGGWRTELAGSGWSSPVVTSDSVLLTAAVPRTDGGGMDLVVMVFDRADGRLRQQFPVFAQTAEDAAKIHNKNSHASPTPVVTDERIFVHFGYQGTAALDRQGKKLWENRELRYPPVHGNGGSPVLVGKALIFTCDGAEAPYVAALHADTGELLWKTPRPVDAARKFSFCTPTAIEVEGKTQVICPGSDCVTALDPSTGRILWQVRYDGYSVVPKPVYADGLVFMATGFGPTRVLAIDPIGSGDVTDSHVRWTLDKGAPKTPSLLAHDGLLYVVSDDGILTVVETADGSSVYKKRLGGNYSASPVLAAGKIYFTSEEGVVQVIAAGRKYQSLASNAMHERTLASPAIVDDSIYLRTEQALYRVQ